MTSPLIAAFNAAALVTSTNVEAVKDQYLAWCNSKAMPQLAAEALEGVARTSKYPARVIANANARYAVLDDAGETGETGGGGGGLDQATVQGLIEDYAVPASKFVDLDTASPDQTLLYDDSISAFKPGDYVAPVVTPPATVVSAQSGAGTFPTVDYSLAQAGDLVFLMYHHGINALTGVNTGIWQALASHDDIAGGAAHLRSYYSVVEGGEASNHGLTGLSAAGNEGIGTWTVYIVRGVDTIDPPSAAKQHEQAGTTTWTPAVAGLGPKDLALAFTTARYSADGNPTLPLAFTNQKGANVYWTVGSGIALRAGVAHEDIAASEYGTPSGYSCSYTYYLRAAA